MTFETKTFNELTVHELHALYALRCKVFVVEQNCPYQEVDEKDKKSIHVLGSLNQQLIACARILPPGVSYNEPSIGRVAVEIEFRKSNKGYELMQYILEIMNSHFPEQDIVISAQEYLTRFYSKLGFLSEGEVYLEDAIPHIKMRKPFISNSSR